jgi:acetyltransferase EpsM
MDVALIHGYSDFAFVDPQKSNQIIHGYPILNYENIESFDNCDVFIAVGQPKIRESIYQKIRNKIPHNRFINLIHPRAVISSSAELGIGNIFFPNSVIGAHVKIGNFSIFNSAAVIEHDSEIGDFVTISPGVNCGGNVKISDLCFLGIGCSIKNNLVIQKECVIGASAYLDKDTNSFKTYIGIPAKPI